MLWGGVAFFAIVVLFIMQKRLAYFMPAALRFDLFSRGFGLKAGAGGLQAAGPAKLELGADGGALGDSYFE